MSADEVPTKNFAIAEDSSPSEPVRLRYSLSSLKKRRRLPETRVFVDPETTPLGGSSRDSGEGFATDGL